MSRKLEIKRPYAKTNATVNINVSGTDPDLTKSRKILKDNNREDNAASKPPPSKEVSFCLDPDPSETAERPCEDADTSSQSDTFSSVTSEGTGRRAGGGRINFKTVSKLVQWGVGSKAEQDTMGKHKRPASEQPAKQRTVRDESQYKEHRRSTEGDVSRDTMRRSSTTPASISRAYRMSLGAIFKDSDKNKKSQLLNMVVREEVRRRKLVKKLRFFIRFGFLLQRWWRHHSVSEVSQTHPFYMQYRMINDLAEEAPESAMEFKASYFKANRQMKMSQESVRILTMKPKLRTKEDVHYAMIALRSIDCIADYPLRMQDALARHGMFQSFGSKRIIVKQGHAPLFFYFILYGTVVVATLETGEPYARTRVTLRRGENFGELAIAQRIPRQSTVLTMEYTEFLTIDCDTYEDIFMAGGVKPIHDPDHNNFMRSLYFLREWPLEKLQSTPKAMEFCYFRRNTVMVKDSNFSEWIYIVKSGSLRVYKKLKKCYACVNKRTGNHTVRAHVDGYQCFMSQESEFHRYAMYNNVSLPSPLCPDSDSDDDDHTFHKYKGNTEEKENLLALPLMQRVERLIRPRTAEGGVIATYGQSKFDKRKRNVASAKSERLRPTTLRQPQSKTQTPRTVSSISNTTTELGLDLSTATQDSGGQDGKRTLMDDFESSAKFKNANTEHEKRLETATRLENSGDINPNAISIRHSVFVTDVRKEITAADLDPEFVLVQTLTKGQAFGVQQVLLEKQPSLILVSGGAECVMLNKKFFKENIDPNGIQKLKQQVSPYPTDEELQVNLQTRVNWLSYRKITLNNLMAQQTEGKPAKLKYKNRALVFK